MAEWGYDPKVYNEKLDQFYERVKGKLPPGKTYTKQWTARFLRARKLDFDKAEDMMLKSVQWRLQNKADGIVDGPSPDQRMLKAMPAGFCGQGRQGHPVYVERTGRAKLHVMLPQIEPRVAEHWKIYMQELGDKLCTAAGVETAIVIMDMDGLKLRNATRQVLDFYKMQGEVDEANYPETLKKIFVINAGWVFLSIWKFAKYFFAEEIRQKVSILGGNYEKELYEAIDPAQLPPFLKGGKHPVSEPWMGDLAYMETLGDLDWKQGLTKIQVGAGKVFEESVKANAGDVIVWEFATEKHNIKFSLWAGDKEVVAEEKHECEENLVTGRHQVTAAGTYKAKFSNEYSFMKGKTLLYKLVVISEAAPSTEL